MDSSTCPSRPRIVHRCPPRVMLYQPPRPPLFHPDHPLLHAVFGRFSPSFPPAATTSTFPDCLLITASISTLIHGLLPRDRPLETAVSHQNRPRRPILCRFGAFSSLSTRVPSTTHISLLTMVHEGRILAVLWRHSGRRVCKTARCTTSERLAGRVDPSRVNLARFRRSQRGVLVQHTYPC